MIIAAAVTAAALHLLPAPDRVTAAACKAPFAFSRRLTVSSHADPGAVELLDDRWRALGLPTVTASAHPDVTTARDGSIPAQGYRLVVRGASVRVVSSDSDGAFNAMMTLAQLAQHGPGGWSLPCVRIADAPALRWRILSDDVSRGPLPNQKYFKERIRTIASFKMNGYSPYMEHVFLSATDPLPAPLDGITPAQLHELALYAKRFHVALIPEQQSFAHMHNTLKVERYADLAALPHAFLLSPNIAGSNEYLKRLVDQELAAVPHPPFFHIGSDETSTLGEGKTADYVAKIGRSKAYADHIVAMNALIAPSGARTMLWDDGIENDPAIMTMLPKNVVIVNWHYGAITSFQKYIDLVAKGGFDQMVAPGANNWNEIFPNLHAALSNEGIFIQQGKESHVFGLFQTVWNDDGESLFEATWYPVVYAAASAWERGAVSPDHFAADFPHAFFGSDDPRFGTDVVTLGNIVSQLEAPSGHGTTNELFWADPFDAYFDARMAHVDLHAVRLESEGVEEHLLAHAPPLHRNAAAVMFLAARKFDLIGRKFQAAQEIRDYYADAVAHAGRADSPSVRDLFWCKYWFWELSDSYGEIKPLFASAWHYEDRDSHLSSILARYDMTMQRQLARADDIQRAIYETYLPTKKLPPLDAVLGLPQTP